jgi:hypothetical protein
LGNRDVGSNGSDEGGASEKALDEKHC